MFGTKARSLKWVCWTSKSDLSSTTKCDQNHTSGNCKFGHTYSWSFCSTNRRLPLEWSTVMLSGRISLNHKHQASLKRFKQKHSGLLTYNVIGEVKTSNINLCQCYGYFFSSSPTAGQNKLECFNFGNFFRRNVSEEEEEEFKPRTPVSSILTTLRYPNCA